MLEIKIRDLNNEEKIYSGIVTSSSFDSPIKEILHKEEANDFVLVFEEKELKLEDTFRLYINVKHAGTFISIFERETFNKEEVINRVSELHSLKNKDYESTVNKVKEMYNILKEQNPIFVIYKPSGKFSIKDEEVPTLIDNVLIFLKKKEDDEEVIEEEVKEKTQEEVVPEEVIPQEETVEKPVKEKKEKPKKVKKAKEKREKVNIIEELKKFFAPVQKNTFHFVFLLIASLIGSFVISTGLYSFYGGNVGIGIFYFVVALAASVLIFFGYNDVFKKLREKNFVILSGCATFLGTLIGTICYLIFRSLQKKDIPGMLPSNVKMLLYTFLIFCAFLLIAIGASYLYTYLKKKKK